MRNKRCEKNCRWIGPYLDGELSSSKSGKVEKHIKFCEACNEELARLQKTRDLIRKGFSDSAGQAAPELEQMRRSVRESIQVSRKKSRGRVEWRIRWFWGTRILVPSAVVMTLVAAFIFTIYKPPAPVVKTSSVNDCIVDSIEGESGTVMLFKTHGSKMTVIWLSGNIEQEREARKIWIEPWV